MSYASDPSHSKLTYSVGCRSKSENIVKNPYVQNTFKSPNLADFNQNYGRTDFPYACPPVQNTFKSPNTKTAIPTWQILTKIMDEQISPMHALPLQTTLLTHSVETPTETTDLRFL